MINILDIVTHTPWWVWVLLVFLVHRGLKAGKTRSIPLKKLFILPAIMMAWGLWGLAETLLRAGSALPLGAALLCAGAGWWLGRILANLPALRADHQAGLVEVEGNFQPLLLFLAVFAVKYAMAAGLALHPQWFQQEGVVQGIAAVDGLVIGLFAGRALRTYQRYQKAPSETLLRGE